LADLFVVPVFRDVGFEQVPRVTDRASGGFALGDQLLKRFPLIIGQGDQVLLVHRLDSFLRSIPEE
jgi:hypothetical protein